MKKNKKMNITLVITAIILTIVVFYILRWSVFTPFGSLVNAGAMILIPVAILGIATLSFLAILIIAIFKCQSLVSLFVVWGITIFIYSIYPIAVVVKEAHKEAIADLESEFYRKAQDPSTSWEEFKTVIDKIERKAVQNSQLSLLVNYNMQIIVFELVHNKRFDFVDKMIEEGHDINAHNMADYLRNAYPWDRDKCSVSRLDQIEYLLSRGCDINDVESENRNSLHITLSEGDEQSAQYLLDKGIDLNKPKDQTSPVAIAAKMNNISMVKQLLAKGGDVNQLQSSPGTPLTYCAWSANKDVIELLLDNGADVNAVDSRGETALIGAIRHNDIEVVELLLLRGADPNILADDGYDAIGIITGGLLGMDSNEQKDKAELLIKAGAILNRTYPNGKTLEEIASENAIPFILRIKSE